jgi:hypothetical protein
MPAKVFVDMGMMPGDLTQHRDTTADREACGERNAEQTAQQRTTTAMEQETFVPADVTTPPIAVEEKNDEYDITLALELSETLATQREIAELESADLAEALMLSKSDDTPAAWLKAVDAVRFRLTRHARSKEVAAVLKNSPKLARVRACIGQKGCEIHPEWGRGMWLLLPLTEEQFLLADLKEPCELDVLMYAGDEEIVNQALKDLPKEIRPKLRKEMHNGDACISLDGECSEADPEFEIIEDRTFLKICASIGEHEGASSAWHSQ